MKNKNFNSFNTTKEVLKHFSIPDLIKVSKFANENADLTKEEQLKLLENTQPELYAKFCKLMGSEA